MQTYEHNPDDFTSVGQSEADKALAVKFFVKPLQDSEATLKEGRPVFRDREYVDIRSGGANGTHVSRPATSRDMQRFPEHYRRFKERTGEVQVVGTLLTEWPQITRSQAEELSFFNVKTVEQLAAMSEVHAGKMMNFHTLKRKANEWLAATREQAPTIALQEELYKRDMQIQALQAQVEQLAALVEAKPEPAQTVTQEVPPLQVSLLMAQVEMLAQKLEAITPKAAPAAQAPAKRKAGRPKVNKPVV